MVPNYATNRGTRHCMVTRHMTNNAADGSAFDATVRSCDHRKRS